MHVHRKISIAVLIVMLAMLAAPFTAARVQEVQSRLAHSNGNGTLRIGSEQFKVTSVIVKLMEDQKVEITLITDITVFLTGTWSAQVDQPRGIDLHITGGASGGGLDASGRVVLSEDGKSVVRLNLKGASRTSKRTVEVAFEAE